MMHKICTEELRKLRKTESRICTKKGKIQLENRK